MPFCVPKSLEIGLAQLEAILTLGLEVSFAFATLACRNEGTGYPITPH